MNKVQEIIKWWSKFNNEVIQINTLNHEFSLDVSVMRLPHLLGLQYANDKGYRGYSLLNYVKHLSDDELLNNIKRYNPQMVESVRERIRYFQYFMEHLEEAVLVEQTNPKTKIKSEFLLIEDEHHHVLHLGIARDREDIDYFETFFVRRDYDYFNESTIQENILSIQKWEHDGTLVPFSFKLKQTQEMEKPTIKMKL